MEPHWTPEQQARLARALDGGETVAYVCTDAWGGPENGGSGTRCEPGAVHEIAGPLEICTAQSLHGTTEPHRWRGDRVWIGIFAAPVARQDDKIGSLRREIVGEIRPEETIAWSVAIRLGPRRFAPRRFAANLDGAYLDGAYCPCPPPPGWTADGNGYLSKEKKGKGE